MEYTDLTLSITPGAEGKYNISATTDLGGGSDAELQLPVTLEDLANIVFGVAETIRGERPTEDAAPTPEETVRMARDFGVKLYTSLIHGDVQRLLDQTRGTLVGQGDVGIRIRLTMDLAGKGMAQVASLPWELIATGPNDLPLVVSKQTVLVRSPRVLEPTELAPFEPPLRILVVSASPDGVATLNLDEEQERIRSTWGTLAGVRVDFKRGRFNELLDYLADEDPHVIHFMGHGEYDSEKGGALIMEGEDGSADWVGSDRLKMLFGDEKKLRLVFLNACKTATTDRKDTGLGPFAGVAASLIRVGVPAVVAMQFPISDDAAITFSDAFYRRIASGDPVDTAVAEARKRLFGGEQSEWATPVLFMRSKDGMLFKPVERLEPDPAPSPPPPNGEEDAEPVSRGGRSTPASPVFRVFLAAPTDALRPRHRQIASGLADDGVEVIANIPEPYEEDAHAEAVRKAVRSADLCVHLLGDRPGEPIGEEGGRTYPLEQLRIALESARSQLILMPEEFEIDTIEDPRYREYLRSLTSQTRDPERLEFMRIGPQQMLDEVRAKRRKLEKATAHAGAKTLTAACVDLHASDLARATDLINYLNEHEIGTLMQSSTDSTPSAAMEAFANNLEQSPLLLVVFGDVARDWVVNRLEWATKQVLRKGLSTRIGVYVTGPEKRSDQLDFPPFYEVVSGIGGFDAGKMDLLIQKVTG